MSIYANDFHQFVDLKNQSDPLQWTTNLHEFNFTYPVNYILKYKLEQNELTLSDGIVGIFQKDSEPMTFLSTTSMEKDFLVKPKIRGNSTYQYPLLKFEIGMSNNKVFHLRQAYTLFDLLGDAGGFNGSIFMIASFIVSAYSARMYSYEIS